MGKELKFIESKETLLTYYLCEVPRDQWKQRKIPILVLSFDLEIMILCFIPHSTHLWKINAVKIPNTNSMIKFDFINKYLLLNFTFCILYT